MTTHPKSPNKSEDQFDLFGSGVSDESSEETINITKHYRTLNILIRLFKVI
jgi:hypothetical protein